MRIRRRILYAVMIGIGIAIVVIVVVLSSRSVGQQSGPTRLVPTEDWGRRISDPATRIQAALQAGREKDDLAEPMLRMQVRKARDDEFRKACVWALGEIGMKESVPELFEVAKDASLPFDQDALENALEALIKIDHDSATAALLWILKESEADARMTAARALAARSEPCIIEALAEATRGGRPVSVRLAALSSLRNGRAASVAGTIRGSLYAESPAIRRAAKEALDDLRGPVGDADAAQDTEGSKQRQAMDAIMAWKVFPGTVGLVAHVKTLGATGNNTAVTALNHAMATARFAPAVATEIEAARRAIAERTGRPLPRATAPPAVGRSYPTTKPTPTPGGLTSNGVLTVTLEDALCSEGNERFDLTLEFERRGARWSKHLWGHARPFNHAEHRAELLESRQNAIADFKVRAYVNDGAWRLGGTGEYRITLKNQQARAQGSYCGQYNSETVKGKATARFMPLPGIGSREPIRDDTHPRLLFREDDLSDIRAAMEHESGTRIIAAFLELFDRPIDNADGELAAAAAHGLFYRLFTDPAHGRRAADLLVSGLADGGPGNADALACRLRNAALAYDLAYDCLSQTDRTRATRRLAHLADAVIPGQGAAGAFDGPPDDTEAAARAASLGFCALATYRENAGVPASPLMPAHTAPAGMTYLEYAVAVTVNSTRRAFCRITVAKKEDIEDRDLATLLLFAHAHQCTAAQPIMPYGVRLKLTPDPTPEPLLPLAWLLTVSGGRNYSAAAAQ